MSKKLLTLFGGGSDGYALDRYTTNLAAAYSLRRLLTSYKGSAIRVREASGNTEADIGFTSAGDLDTVALLAHCGANSGYVTTWYDQSVTAHNLATAVAGEQPRIVDSGAVEVDGGGVPQVKFDGTDDCLYKIGIVAASSHQFAVVSPGDTARRIFAGGLLDNSGCGFQSKFFTGLSSVKNATVNSYSAAQTLVTIRKAASEDYRFRVNGADDSGGTSNSWRGAVTKIIGATDSSGTPGSLFWLGGIQEIFAYSTSQAGYESAIEAKIATYYGITLS